MKTGPIVAVVVALALVGLLGYGLAAKRDSKTIDNALAKGDAPAAPARTLPVLDSDGYKSPADFEGQVVVLNFWASWCDPCKDEAKLFERMQRRLKAEGSGTVLGVTFRDAEPDSRGFEKQFGLTYPSLRDVDGELAKDYGVAGLPETFVIDPRGRIVHAVRGAIDRGFYEREVAPVVRQATS